MRTPSSAAFYAGNVAMATLPLETRIRMRGLDLDWDVAPMFNRPEGRPFINLTGNAFGITTNSRDPDAAWEFVRYTLDREGQLITAQQGAMPARLEAIRSDAFLHEPGVEGLSYTIEVLLTQFGSFPYGEGEGGEGIPSEINRLFREALGAIETGSKLASMAFAEIKDSVEALLRAARR